VTADPPAGLDLSARVAFAAGRAELVRELFVAHRGRVLALCLHVTGRRAEAEDALQETFLAVHRALPGLLDATVAALARLDEVRCGVYTDFLLSMLRGAVREKLMHKGEWVFRSDFAKKYIAIGKAEGRERGHAEAKAEDVLAFLAARGLPVPDDVAARVRACADLGLLDRWVRRAATVDRAEDLFAE
jgi:hypothetical protein